MRLHAVRRGPRHCCQLRALAESHVASQADGTSKNTELMADYVRRATLLWLDLRSVAAADPPSAEQRRQLEAYNAEHLAFVRKDPDNSVRRGDSIAFLSTHSVHAQMPRRAVRLQTTEFCMCMQVSSQCQV